MTSDRFRFVAMMLFWTAVAGACVLAILPQPPQLPTDTLGDKFNHILAFSTMAAFAAAAYPQTPRLRVIERLSFLGALIELVQSIPALHRDCDVRDWIADTIAVAVVTGIVALIARRSRRFPGQ